MADCRNACARREVSPWRHTTRPARRGCISESFGREILLAGINRRGRRASGRPSTQAAGGFDRANPARGTRQRRFAGTSLELTKALDCLKACTRRALDQIPSQTSEADLLATLKPDRRI
jgi:hypothetical protein